MKVTNTEFRSFIFVGITSVFLDFLFYKILIKLNILIFFSKGISFLIGALFSYFANKRFTFKSKGGKKVFLKFILVYVAALFLNVFVNTKTLHLLNVYNYITLCIAFVFATLSSAFFNFIGLKKFVFVDK